MPKIMEEGGMPHVNERILTEEEYNNLQMEIENGHERIRIIQSQRDNIQGQLDRERALSAAYRLVIKDLSEDI